MHRTRRMLIGVLVAVTVAAVTGGGPVWAMGAVGEPVIAGQTQEELAPAIGQVKRLYRTILGRDAELDGLEYWMGRLADGAAYRDLAWAFLASQEWEDAVGPGLGDEEFVTRLYRQAFGRDPDPAGLAYWRDDVLGTGTPQYGIVRWFAESREQRIATAPTEELALHILHVNDHHSHLAPDGISLDLAGAGTDVAVGGFPRMVAKFRELEGQLAGENVMKIHAGDAITGTLYYSLFEGEPDAALMNEICFDAFVVGNHEFDDGDQGLADFLDFLGASDTCATPVLAANVVPGTSSPLVEGYLRPRIVEEYGGELVGYVGIDIADKTRNSSSPDPDTQFLDEVETAQVQIDELRAAGVDKVVLVTHYRYDNDLALAELVRGVDVIVGGDSHSLLGDRFTRYGLDPAGPYPTITTDRIGAPVCIAQAWEYSKVVGHLEVAFDEYGLLTRCEGTPHLLLGDDFSRDDIPLAGVDLSAVIAEIDGAAELSVVVPDPTAQTILDGFTRQIQAETARVIGTVPEDLCLERIPGQGRSTLCDVAITAQRGGDIQQLVAEAFRARSLESDIAIQNAGGVRIDVAAGDLTIATAYEILPFSNTLVNLEMTGTQVKAVLEDAFDFALQPDGSTGAYPYAAGLRWDADALAAKGSRLTNLEYRAKGSTAWVGFDLDATYTVVTNDFVAAGRDGYITFATIPDDLIVDTFINYTQVLIDYVEKDLDGTVTKVPADDYSTQSFVPLR